MLWKFSLRLVFCLKLRCALVCNVRRVLSCCAIADNFVCDVISFCKFLG